jgi:hypothetical protein
MMSIKIYKVSQYLFDEFDVVHWSSLEKAESDFQDRLNRVTSSHKHATKEECDENKYYRNSPVIIDDEHEFDYVRRAYIAFWHHHIEIIDGRVVDGERWYIGSLDISIEEIDIS